HDPATIDFAKHLVSLQATPSVQAFAVVLRLLNADGQKAVIRAMLNSGRLRKEEAEPLAKAVAKQLGLPEAQITPKTETAALGKIELSGWDAIRELIASRAAPGDITAAIRNRLHAKYDADEVKESWLVLAESDPMTFVRIFSLLPYLPDGQTDPIARAVLESYTSRLTHEKYASTYAKVIATLKNLFRVKADSPALVNFIALVKWVDPDSAEKITKDIGMAA
ncbi:MAG TPA: hypothetical protein VIK53_14430, partial [Verrucomicrobiae bacterium]